MTDNETLAAVAAATDMAQDLAEILTRDEANDEAARAIVTLTAWLMSIEARLKENLR